MDKTINYNNDIKGFEGEMSGNWDFSVEINGEEKIILVKKYLPVSEKIELIQAVTTNLINAIENKYYYMNPLQIEVLLMTQVVKYYTNIEVTDEELEHPDVVYDELMQAGIMGPLKSIMYTGTEDEFKVIYQTVMEIGRGILNHTHSALGVVEALSTDYDNLKFDSEEITKNISNPENLTLLKDIVTKLG